jgi:hypothetical protein
MINEKQDKNVAKRCLWKNLKIFDISAGRKKVEVELSFLILISKLAVKQTANLFYTYFDSVFNFS